MQFVLFAELLRKALEAPKEVTDVFDNIFINECMLYSVYHITTRININAFTFYFLCAE